MHRRRCRSTAAVVVAFLWSGACGRDGAPKFTRLVALPAPKIVGHAEEYPGGMFNATNLVDGNMRTEHSSNAKGLDTFVELDFGKTVALAAFTHLDRADPATVAASELRVLAEDGTQVARFAVTHAAVPGGLTTFIFPAPVTGRRVRWQVTALGPRGYGTVGGAELRFFSAAAPESSPANLALGAAAFPAIEREPGSSPERLLRTLRVTIDYPYAEPVAATIEVAGAPPQDLRLSFGVHAATFKLPAVEGDASASVTIKSAGATLAATVAKVAAVRAWELYLLPHSHVDIGYTHVQTEVEERQWRHLDQALDLCRKTADYPAGAQFKWNSEVLWAVDSYVRRASNERRAELIAAVKAGQVELDALYGNELTGLCRPEELLRLLECARRLSREFGVAIDTAMISDVPGYTWGIVPALALGGVKYFSVGTNHCHRIGRTLEAWGDRPFRWVSPSGREKVLCWLAGKGYSWFHPGLQGTIRQTRPEAFFDYLAELEAAGYPYDIVQLRYSIGGDNGPPDPELPEFVKEWNARYVRPRLRIATAGEMMRELERRYGERIPEVRGDFTPYWEDGAASSSAETALARNAAERLVQAQALWAMVGPAGFPAEDFTRAWRSVILYNEHTWGAHCSITEPDSDFTRSQWAIKKAFADAADKSSQSLLEAAATRVVRRGSGVPAVHVINTCSWPRTDLVVLAAQIVRPGDRVRDAQGRTVRSQRLSTGELAFVAQDVPPFGARRFVVEEGAAEGGGAARVEGRTVSAGRIRVAVSEKTGAIASLTTAGVPVDLAGTGGLGEYVYVAGRDPKNAHGSGAPRFTVKEAGPLVASLVVESDAPGCNRVTREVRVVDGLDRVDLLVTIDKRKVRTPEGVHLGFACNVPGGQLRIDVPWGIVRPELDQLAGACKNYFSVGRWADVSNEACGLTVATLDCPLLEVGSITVDVPRPLGTEGWVERLAPARTFYSYLMNNYWETNYKADQEGPTAFRYAFAPHGRFDEGAAARFAIERSQPLVAVLGLRETDELAPQLVVDPPDVIVSSLEPREDGRGVLVRLFNTTSRPCAASLVWSAPAPARVRTVGPNVAESAANVERIELPPFGIVTLEAAMPDGK